MISIELGVCCVHLKADGTVLSNSGFYNEDCRVTALVQRKYAIGGL